MSALLGKHDVVVGQVLLTPYDFFHRSQYLHARVTLQHLLDLGVLPIVNENDTVADDEIRYGDNDRLAALVSHMLGADVLLMLTDTAGVFTADPRRDDDASLIEEIVEVDAALEQVAGGAGTERGSGGMASKLAAAKIAAWSGVRAVIASAALPGVVDRRARGPPGRHVVRAARAAAPEPQALDRVRASVRRQDRRRRRRAARARRRAASRCCPPVCARSTGDFDADAAVEIVDDDGAVFAKGLCRYTSLQLQTLPRPPDRRSPRRLPPRGRPPRRPVVSCRTSAENPLT